MLILNTSNFLEKKARSSRLVNPANCETLLRRVSKTLRTHPAVEVKKISVRFLGKPNCEQLDR